MCKNLKIGKLRRLLTQTEMFTESRVFGTGQTLGGGTKAAVSPFKVSWMWKATDSASPTAHVCLVCPMCPTTVLTASSPLPRLVLRTNR